MIQFRSNFNLIFAAAFSLVLSGYAFGQTGSLVSSNRVGSLSASQFNKRLNEVYGSSAPEPLRGALNLYKVTYRSSDANGRNVVLSGLVVLPANGAPNGLVVFNHGTTVYNGHLPSRFNGSQKGIEAEIATLAFGGGGYAIAMPDYIGQGDHAVGHPYPANVANAQAGIDLIKAARALARRNNIEIGSSLNITGYSEGGGVAMAQVRELERLNIQVTAAAPASGPYDLSGSTRQFMLEQPTDQAGFVVRTYLLGALVYGLHKTKSVKITDYFRSSMAFAINNSYGGRITDEAIIKRVALTAVLMRAQNNLFNVVTPRFKRVMETLDLRDPAAKQLKDNDCYDWSPRTKMLLINLEGDAIVSPRNTEVAFRTMRRRGIARDTLRRSIIRDAKLNHITAMPEAMLRARNFFDGGFQAVRDLDEN
ncbi:MAG: alpha/beta hydrolase family protein [Pyrinomonadaceae bacterium]